VCRILYFERKSDCLLSEVTTRVSPPTVPLAQTADTTSTAKDRVGILEKNTEDEMKRIQIDDLPKAARSKRSIQPVVAWV
jgi:hypothetical protein